MNKEEINETKSGTVKIGYKIVRNHRYGEGLKITTLYDSKNVEVLSGKWWDGIDEQIKGFLTCLDYLCINYNVSEEDINLSKDK